MSKNKTVGRRVTWTQAVTLPLAAAAFACCTSMAPARAQSGSSGASALSSAGLEVQGRRFLGPVRNMGNGKIRSYVTLGIAGTPREVGIVFTQRALTGLPDTLPETEYTLPLPKLPRLPFSTLPLVYGIGFLCVAEQRFSSLRFALR